MNILVIKDAGLGDTILTSSFLREVRKHLRVNSLDFVGDPKAKQALPFSLLDRVYFFDRGEVAALPIFTRIKKEFQFLLSVSKRRYSIAFDLTGSLRSAILTLVSRAGMRCGFYTKGLEDIFYNLRVKRSPFRYEADNYLELLRALGKTDLSPIPFFPLNSEAVEQARDILLAAEIDTRFIGINPGASIPIKRWPEENFARLADQLSKREFSVGIIEGPGEKGIGSRIEELMEYSPIQIRGLPLDVIGAIISKMRLLVSNDTAILHLGVAVGAPTLGIFGPTNPIQYTPPEARHYYIRSDLSCSPCNRLECERARECLRRISVEAVLERVWRIVGETE